MKRIATFLRARKDNLDVQMPSVYPKDGSVMVTPIVLTTRTKPIAVSTSALKPHLTLSTFIVLAFDTLAVYDECDLVTMTPQPHVSSSENFPFLLLLVDVAVAVAAFVVVVAAAVVTASAVASVGVDFFHSPSACERAREILL